MPSQIVAKLRRFEVRAAQGRSIAEAARSIGVSEPKAVAWTVDV